jgi:hypothetical protein
MARPCKSLLIPRADPAPMAGPPGVVIVDACRSLLIARFGPLRADASASALSGTGARPAPCIVNRCRALLTARPRPGAGTPRRRRPRISRLRPLVRAKVKRRPAAAQILSSCRQSCPGRTRAPPKPSVGRSTYPALWIGTGLATVRSAARFTAAVGA